MTSRTHDIFAFAALLSVGTYFPPSGLNLTTAATAVVGSIVGSLLPDIDQASNRLWDLLPAGHFFGGLLRRVFIAHRTLSHSIVGVVLVYKVLEWGLPKILNPDYINVGVVLAAIMIGFVSHLIADGFTEEGLPLFFPIKWRVGFPPIASWRIKTGGGFEKFVVFPAILIYIVWFVSSNYERMNEVFRLAVK